MLQILTVIPEIVLSGVVGGYESGQTENEGIWESVAGTQIIT
jgi:hypothetical protein